MSDDGMDLTIPSGDLSLTGYLAVPAGPPAYSTAVVICHGFPGDRGGGANSVRTYPAFADRVAEERSCVTLTFTYRGCGQSEGDFSLQGWLEDLHAAVAYVRARPEIERVLLVGFGTGGSLSICAAATDPSIVGIAALASPSDFDNWAEAPDELLEHALACEVIKTEGFPEDFEAWSAELTSVRPVDVMAQVADRHVLILHGTEDDLVTSFDALDLSNAHENADLQMLAGAGHHLRHDPRATAILGSWIADQLTRAQTPENLPRLDH